MTKEQIEELQDLLTLYLAMTTSPAVTQWDQYVYNRLVIGLLGNAEFLLTAAKEKLGEDHRSDECHQDGQPKDG